MARTSLLLSLLFAAAVITRGVHGWFEASNEDSSSSEENGDHNGGCDGDMGERIWRFHLGHHIDFGAWSYIDTDGDAAGFFPELITAICEKAGKKCHYLIDDYDHCWKGYQGTEKPGTGLMAGWYDGCIGFLPTPDRMNSFDFTTGFTPLLQGALYYRTEDEEIHSFAGKNVGFVDGWAMGKLCLSRQFGISDADEYVPHFYSSPKELVKALHAQEVDVAFTTAILDEAEMNVKPSKRRFQCAAGGISVMFNKGNTLAQWWDKAFHDLRASGGFAELCASSQRRHGHRGQLSCIH